MRTQATQTDRSNRPSTSHINNAQQLAQQYQQQLQQKVSFCFVNKQLIFDCHFERTIVKITNLNQF